jgi:hypothetical protein
MDPEFKINNEHWDVYIDGKFYCSADSRDEAEREYKEYLKENK